MGDDQVGVDVVVGMGVSWLGWDGQGVWGGMGDGHGGIDMMVEVG